jgi:hypothetical protein
MRKKVDAQSDVRVVEQRRGHDGLLLRQKRNRSGCCGWNSCHTKDSAKAPIEPRTCQATMTRPCPSSSSRSCGRAKPLRQYRPRAYTRSVVRGPVGDTNTFACATSVRAATAPRQRIRRQNPIDWLCRELCAIRDVASSCRLSTTTHLQCTAIVMLNSTTRSD